MLMAAASPLSDWTNFYVIIGSSAGALTGLTFVVITLTAQIPGAQNSGGLATFTSPTVVHFSVVLLTAIALSAPWPLLAQASVALGLVGLAALGYTLIVLRRMRRMERTTNYKPVLEDWLCHVVAPVAAYATLIGAAIVLPDVPIPALFCVAGALALILLISIHNAWDVVAYLVVERLPHPSASDADDTGKVGDAHSA